MNAPFPSSPAPAPAVADVIQAGAQAEARGWVPATAGNFSARVNARQIAITRSGADKGALTPNDIWFQDLDAPLRPGSSAEAELHLRLYRDHPDIGAVLHVHSLGAVVVGRAQAEVGAVRLEGRELQKALRGVTTHEAALEVPIFANDQDVSALAERVARRLAEAPVAPLTRAPGYLLAGHGLYAWGRDAREAWRHLEALETLFQQILSYRSFRP